MTKSPKHRYTPTSSGRSRCMRRSTASPTQSVHAGTANARASLSVRPSPTASTGSGYRKNTASTLFPRRGCPKMSRPAPTSPLTTPSQTTSAAIMHRLPTSVAVSSRNWTCSTQRCASATRRRKREARRHPGTIIHTCTAPTATQCTTLAMYRTMRSLRNTAVEEGGLVRRGRVPQV